MDLYRRTASALDRLGRFIAPHVPEHTRAGRVLRRVRRSLPGRSRVPALYGLIAEFARANPSAFFVQIGSNDGASYDPLHQEILRRRWRGVMVEPIPHIFERLRRNYEGVADVHLENVAIADHDGSMRLYYIPEDPGGETLPGWYQALASFDKDVILQHRDEIPDIDRRVTSIDVPCVTFESLCRKLAIEHVDLVHTDTEGYDAVILRSIDLDRLRPKLIMFEHFHLSLDVYHACIERLRGFGYGSLACGMDTICLRLDQLSDGDRRLRRLWLRSHGEDVLVFRSDVAGERVAPDTSQP